MLAIKAQYKAGRIELIEPIPADILSAELNIIVIPSEETNETTIPAAEYHARRRSSDEEFKQIGLAAFFDTNDDANVDWEAYFELK
ncbi:MAG: hypothetical protein M0P74_01690 [Syntrophales bacterium]|jgi:hypothetical protein|nr:hypothetical protein [Syntrophales bacterium]